MPPLDIAGIPRPAPLPIAQPQAQHGNAAASLQKFQAALQLMQEALPGVPMGTELHTKALTIIKDLAKGLQEVKSDPALQIQTLLQAARQQSQQSPMAALNRMYPAAAPGGAGAPAGGGGGVPGLPAGGAPMPMAA